MTKSITYEFPLNERIRMFIRIEQLFFQLQHFMAGSTVHDRRATLKTLLDLLMIFSRNDLKSEVIKEIERHAKAFSLMGDSENVDKVKLGSILNELNRMSKKLYDTNGKIGINLMKIDLFQSISQRISIPGGTCSFDLPAFHYWLEQDPKVLERDLENWTRPFNDLRTSISMLLDFIRNSGHTSQNIAEAGFFQLALDPNQLYQMLLIKLDTRLPYFVETSGGKHRFTIRLMHPSVDGNRPSQAVVDVPFSLTCCTF